MKKVMIVDCGARGHALALAYLKSSQQVLVTPGNKGMEGNFINQSLGHKLNILVDASSSLNDPLSILEVANEYMPDLIDVAQDNALAAGTVDILKNAGFNVFGPSKNAAQIEWDKEWSREFMSKYNISQPEYKIFDIDEDPTEYAESLIEKCGIVFFKASGLYAGKGVLCVKAADEIDDALSKLRNMGQASSRFLVEEGLDGEEFSFFVLSDGENFVNLGTAQDHKRIGSQDAGENTGGMGAYSPALVVRGAEEKITSEIIAPVLRGLKKEGRPYKGILYLGGMLCKDGNIKVIEFNSRWGDPECHVILPCILSVSGSYTDLVDAAIKGRLNKFNMASDGLTRVCIVGASAGYPNKYEKGKQIVIDYSKIPEGTYFLSAGIDIKNNLMYNAGGRVFSIVASGKDIIDARRKALYAMANCYIEGNNLYYRSDIAWRDIERLLKKE